MYSKNQELEFGCGALIKPFDSSALFKVWSGRFYVFHLTSFQNMGDNIYINGSAQLTNAQSDGVIDGYINAGNQVMISGKAFIFSDRLADESYYPDVTMGQSSCIVDNKDYYIKEHGVYRQPTTNAFRDYIISSAYDFNLQNGVLSKDYIPHPLGVKAGVKSGQFIL